MSVIHWSEISLFHNVKKYTQAVPEITKGNSTVSYRSKVKLHGSCCAVQVHKDGSLVTQSRTTVLTPTDDYAGFSKFVHGNDSAWKKVYPNTVYFGEWCGTGIQKSVAISEIGKKVFAVFAARSLDSENDQLIVEPDALRDMLLNCKDLPDVHVLPWYPKSIVVDWSQEDSLQAVQVEAVNWWVNEIEKNDPWVEATFGVKGTGEGLVFYPYSQVHLGAKSFSELAWKAKGEAHRVLKTKAAVQVSAEVASGIDQFIDMVLTTPRLEQGAKAVVPDGSFDMKLTGKFLAWIETDIQKECQDELQASKLTWKDVQKTLSLKARTWYLTAAKSKL